ncbi:MAG TPA: ABC transporter ATP-binding protein [Pyrinomonadaceae bacterium]|jgi:lipopolysaccharide transport system ATP-binding protein
MKPIIRVENLSKRYSIGGLDAGYATFREMFAGVMAAPFRRLRKSYKPTTEVIWALKDINFEVQPGEVVGLIGHNGAGKSTLLKILSRITIPTTGRSEVYGRIGSLLEVGTGFHPDLTGRENIFLNGTILGIRRSEIARRFDEIVAFSEIEKFIDTPVKWYSSGMYLRLAFSVAVHLDTEVLIMDEVLAVGDMSFQQKCLDKMSEIRKQGHTILFVSHNMAAVTRLCERVLLIDKGHIVRDGEAHVIVNEYMGASLKVTSEKEWVEGERAPGNHVVRLRKVRARDEEGRTAESVDIRKRVGVEMTYDVLEAGHMLTPKILLSNEEGANLFSSHDVGPEWRSRPREKGTYVSTLWIPGNFLSEGNVLIHAAIESHLPSTATHVYERDVATFQIVDKQHGDSARGDYIGPIPGLLRPLLDWTTDFQIAGAPDASPLEVTLHD